MPTPDPTGLNLIKAGDYAGANEFHQATHPTGFNDTMALAVKLLIDSPKATSGSSVAIGTGSRQFQLTVPRSWPNGLPIYIMEAGAPSTNYMVGTLSADETSGGLITVNVTSAAGSGTFTSWTIVALLAALTVASPPLAIAQGGTGGTTKALARESIECPRLVTVAAIEASPAAAAVFVTAYPAQQVLIPVGGLDDFAGHDLQLAKTADGGSTWSFETLGESNLVWSQDAGAYYVMDDAGAAATPDRVLRLSPYPVSTTTVSSAGGSYSPPFDKEVQEFTLFVMATPFTVTLPNQADGIGYKWRIINTTAGTVTINVASAGTINGSASSTLVGAYTNAVFIQRVAGVYIKVTG